MMCVALSALGGVAVHPVFCLLALLLEGLLDFLVIENFLSGMAGIRGNDHYMRVDIANIGTRQELNIGLPVFANGFHIDCVLYTLVH